jgi:exo-1,4-beta-D-glucosaminidase
LEFNTEAGPSGEQIPPIESLRKMMPEHDLWPMSKSWNIRLHKAFFPDARAALNSRYGTPAAVSEYCMKSQVLQYEATRAMFEAFAGNKYRSSGIIYWMYNSAWPTMYWQLYDYYFTPNGAFYGTKKACELLHIQYSYDDGSIQVVNNYYKDFRNLKASARLYNLDMVEKYSKEGTVDILADQSRKVLFLNLPEDLSDVFFLKLELVDSISQKISSNFYWLSMKGDEAADFTILNRLSEVKLNLSVSPLQQEESKCLVMVEIENPSSSLAFFINPKIIRRDSKDLILPVFWEDNYFSLLPGEKQKVTVEFASEDVKGEVPVLVIDGWNITHLEKELK